MFRQHRKSGRGPAKVPASEQVPLLQEKEKKKKTGKLDAPALSVKIPFSFLSRSSAFCAHPQSAQTPIQSTQQPTGHNPHFNTRPPHTPSNGPLGIFLKKTPLQKINNHSPEPPRPDRDLEQKKKKKKKKNPVSCI
jgi:hypothetical protein